MIFIVIITSSIKTDNKNEDAFKRWMGCAKDEGHLHVSAESFLVR